MAEPETGYHMLQASKGRDMFDHAPSFPLWHRLFRLCWRAAWVLLAAWTPPPLHRWRIFLANLFGAKIAPGAMLYASANIWYPPNLTMAPRAVLGPGVNCYCMAPVAIGSRAVISQGAFLCTGTHDIHGVEFQIRAKPISIGAGSWICAEAFVGPGVNVGEGAVLAARGAAFRDLDPWTVYLGNPATRKGERTRRPLH